MNILYFLCYQKTFFLYKELYYKKPKKLPVLSYLSSPDVYKSKLPVYNQNHTNKFIHANNYINKYIKNKLL